ncbi:MAG: hypothetical protein JW784_04150 [Candidatus Cloacimonetes bacterium]|nr:hypothetical protein [Candidatus Cloacimonadota bacterium]
MQVKIVIIFLFFLLLSFSEAINTSHYLPFGQSWAADQLLPLPLGLGATYYMHDQIYRLDRLHLNLDWFTDDMTEGLSVDNQTKEMNLKFDIWVLPFANVFGLIGSVKGETKVDLSDIPAIDLNNINIKYDGMVYGGGLTLVYGLKNLFTTATITATSTRLNDSTSDMKSWVFTPKAGINVPGPFFLNGTALWVGGMYQETEEMHQGHIYIEQIQGNEEVEYEVTLGENQPWNYLAGLCANLTRRWQLELEAGFGERQHAIASLVFRF